MTTKEKAMLIAKINIWLDNELKTDDDVQAAKPDVNATDEEKPIEMLTLKECMKSVKGVSQNMIRKLVLQGKIPSIKVGDGKNKRYLVSKDSLIAFMRGVNNNE